MDINQMHILFRTIGQQMGLQHVRGILPESIDIFLNVAINEKCRGVLIQNTSTPFNDKLSIQRNNTSPINALSTLYSSDKITSFTKEDDCYEVQMPTLNNSNVFQFVSFFVGFEDKTIVWHRQCRLIEFDKLYSVIDDYCNRPDNEHPIISLYNDSTGSFRGKLFMKDYSLLQSLVFNYIRKPVEVKWNEDVNFRVNCDLPEYIHHEIVEMAVQKYFQSVGSTTKQAN